MKKRPPAPTVDPGAVFLQAKLFWWADRTLRSKSAPFDQAIRVAVPAMVLSAFASELFLKCILLVAECVVCIQELESRERKAARLEASAAEDAASAAELKAQLEEKLATVSQYAKALEQVGGYPRRHRCDDTSKDECMIARWRAAVSR
jgi:hypothetical protein